MVTTDTLPGFSAVPTLHELVRDGDVAGIKAMESKCTPAEWQRALCGRDHTDLTPLAVACQIGNVETVSALLSLGSAKSIFVRDFRPSEIMCTLPYVSVDMPDRHVSAQGRALACQRQELFELAEKERSTIDALKDLVDSSLARYIQDLTAGSIEFYSDSAETLLRDDTSASEASTVRSRETMSAGDFVRLKPGLPGSTILISQRGTENGTASQACLGAEVQKRIGVVVRTFRKTLVVASLSSGHLCEYNPQDLIFADGTSLSSEFPCRNAKQAGVGLETGDLVTFVPRALGSAPPRTPDSTSPLGAHDDAPLVRGPKAGDVVTMTSDEKGAPPGHSTMAFSVGETITVKDVKQHDGKWYATCTRYSILWFPLSSTDWEGASLAGGCCAVTKTNFAKGLKVVRGPAWEWGNQDGGEGNDGVLGDLDSDGWARVTWSKGGSDKYRVVDHQDLQYHKDNCVCLAARATPPASQPLPADNSALNTAKQWMPAPGEVLVVSSLFHPKSTRGIVVSRLDDPSQQWLASRDELSPAAFPVSSHKLKTGDVVRLHSAAKVSSAKCLGTPGSDRSGVVIFAGATCKGIQRNIEVASIQEVDGDEGPIVAVSLYSSLDLVRVPRCTYKGNPSERQALALEESLAALGETTRMKDQFQAQRLVQLFGLSVWERVWRIFAAGGNYMAAFQAFCAFQRSRVVPDLDEPYLQILECRRLLEPASTSAFASAVEAAICEEKRSNPSGAAACSPSWSCHDCFATNAAARKTCQVCAGPMPTFKCGVCLQVQPVINNACSNCLQPNPSYVPPSTPPSAVSSAAPSPCGCAEPASSDGTEFDFNHTFFFLDDPETSVCARTPVDLTTKSSDAEEELFFGCRVQIKADGELAGKSGRVLKVVTLPDENEETPQVPTLSPEFVACDRVRLHSLGPHHSEFNGKEATVVFAAGDSEVVVKTLSGFRLNVNPRCLSLLSPAVDGSQPANVKKESAPSSLPSFSLGAGTLAVGSVVQTKQLNFSFGNSRSTGQEVGSGGLAPAPILRGVLHEYTGGLASVRWNDGTVTRVFPFTLEKAKDDEGSEAPAKAPVEIATPSSASAPHDAGVTGSCAPVTSDAGIIIISGCPAVGAGRLRSVNGSYEPVDCNDPAPSGSTGAHLYKMAGVSRHSDMYIEYYPALRQWQVKPKQSLGLSDKAYLVSGSFPGQEGGPHQARAGQWKVHNSDSKTWDLNKNIVVAIGASNSANLGPKPPATPLVCFDPDDSSTRAFLCEIGVEGKIRRVMLKRAQLALLPGKPSNFPLCSVQGEVGAAQACDESLQHMQQAPWKMGTLVRLISTAQQSGLLSGREAGALGCIASVDLEKNLARVSVPCGLERRLSQFPAQVGDMVRLVAQSASIGEARHGPLKPGQRGKVLTFREGLVLVQVSETSPVDGIKGNSGVEEFVPSSWWYAPDALAHDELHSSLAQKKHELALQEVEKSSASNKGVYFDVVNNSARPILIKEIVAGAYGSSRDATLFACLKGGQIDGAPFACEGNEKTPNWCKVAAGTLKEKKSTPVLLTQQLTLAPGQVQGFLLHCQSDGVRYSPEGESFKNSDLEVRPWHATCSRSPHDSDFESRRKYCFAGRIKYEIVTGNYDEVEVDLKQLQVMRKEEQQDVPVARVVEFIATGARAPSTCARTSKLSTSAARAQGTAMEMCTGTKLEKWTKTQGIDAAATCSSTQLGNYIAITHMNKYKDWSFEELRVQDYDANMKKCQPLAAGIERPATLLSQDNLPVPEDVPDFPEDEAAINTKMHEQVKRVDDTSALAVSRPTSATVIREDSSSFYKVNAFQVIPVFGEWVSGRDRAGNTVAHHLAMADMPKSLKELYSQDGALRWVANDELETPQMLSDGLHSLSPSYALLHRAIHDGGLLRADARAASMAEEWAPPHLVRRALGCPLDYKAPDQLEELLAQSGSQGEGLPDPSHALSHLCSALGMMQGNFDFSPKQVMLAVRDYLEHSSDGQGDAEPISPVLYLVHLLLYQKQASKSKFHRHRAACALSAIQCFPAFAAMPQVAKIVKDADAEGVSRALFLQGVPAADEEEDDEVAGDDEADEVSDEWKTAKASHKLASASMDELMRLTGLTDIKKKALAIVKEVLLRQGRPASVKADTSMNFLFTGNPGCGKTTVARLLAKAMTELGFRTNPQMVETSAQDILKLKDPATDFAQMFDSAKGGTLFIDEAYRFSPAKPGSNPNASNQVLDFLLEAVEKPEVRSTTTVILAGYRDEIEDLLAYNVGFSSRFPLEFAFEDYSERQLRQIFMGMVKDRGMRLERKKECGVSISTVMAARIHQGAGKKGFGNAREVRNKLEQVITAQSQRIGTRKLRKMKVTEGDYKTLTALDALGHRPNFAHCAPMRAMDAMVGLSAVKAEFRKLVLMSQQNYDREMRGDKPERLSLHRCFYGNPGTGKTTVAKMYGDLLKELGLLSKGDFISVTPADLTGDAEGGAATNTKAVLDRAKGKVLLIDEAYILDPKRKNNQYGGNVLDTLVEKLDGEAGSDIAVVLAGYKQEMFDMLENNPGLRRRFNIDDFGIHFNDFSDEELKAVLISMASKSGLIFDSLDLVDAVVALVGQKRRMPGFGNAGTMASMLNFAKAAKAGRLGEAQQALEEARRQGSPAPPMPDPDVLVRQDFIPQEEVDAAAAREAFANLYNTEHIVEVLDKLEALIVTAKEEGREPADLLADSHMVFVGPPGTGKTTVAMRFGKLFKDLDILPSDNVTVVTGTSLMGQYVGETKEKVLKAMNQARGGILFIDEAYGIAGSSHGSSSFGREAIDTLVGKMTSEEFKGNLLVIMAGYEQQMDALFANANPGFSSRFNKKRIEFKPWTAQQTADAVVAEVQKSGKSITAEAQARLGVLCRQLQSLPLYGSARDVFETILPNLYTERANRLYAFAKANHTTHDTMENTDGQSALFGPPGPCECCLPGAARPQRRSPNLFFKKRAMVSPQDDASEQDTFGTFSENADASQPDDSGTADTCRSKMQTSASTTSVRGAGSAAPYETADVEAALGPVIESRRKMAASKHDASSFALSWAPEGPVKGSPSVGGGQGWDDAGGDGGGDDSCNAGQSGLKHKAQVKYKVRHIDDHEDEEDEGESDVDVWAALEQACQELGYDEEFVAEFLGEEGDYPDELLERIMSITSCNDVAKIRRMLDKQKGAVLARILAVIEHKKKEKSEEEARCQQKLQEMGRCPLDYEWLKEEGGWRCAGGSHYISDADIASLMT